HRRSCGRRVDGGAPMRKLTLPLVSCVVAAALSCSKGPEMGTSAGGGKSTGAGTGGAGTGGGAASTSATSGKSTSAATTGTTGAGTTSASTTSAATSSGTGGKDAGTKPSACSGAVHSTAAAGPTLPAVALTVPSGFTLTT